MQALREQEQQHSKRCKASANDILAEKIVLEKTRLEEADEIQKMRRSEEHRNNMQKELEFTEQRDTMAKFELLELKRVHEELTVALVNMQKENDSVVGPVLKLLNQQVTACVFLLPLPYHNKTRFNRSMNCLLKSSLPKNRWTRKLYTNKVWSRI